MTIYFDVGNTNIKIHFIIYGKKYYFYLSTNDDYSIESFYNFLPIELKNKKIERIFICSIVPNLTILIKKISKRYFNINPFIIELDIKTGFQNNIDNPKELGNDLICLGAYANNYNNNTIIINLGTTTTITHVKNKKFMGVIIMPGLIMNQKSIVNSASLINFSRIYFSKKSIGSNTREALSIGIINSHIFALEKHINNIDNNAKIIISGGNSKKIIDYINIKYKYVKEATIEGIKILENINEY